MSIGRLDSVLQAWRECSQQSLSLSDLTRLFSSCRLPFLTCLPFLILYIWVCMCLWAQVPQRSETPDPPELVVQQWWAPQHGFWALRSSVRSAPTPNYQATAPARERFCTAGWYSYSQLRHSAAGGHGRWLWGPQSRKGREKHAEICSTKWESFSFVIKPWPYCLGAKLASLFIIFCSCNRRVNAENPSKTVGVNAAGYMWLWGLTSIGRDEGSGESRERMLFWVLTRGRE